MTSRASTFCASFSTPSRAWLIFGSPSHLKGMVTMPTVRMPIFFASRAITGAAPVPVPPPIPAVMNTIRVPSLRQRCISSRLSSAACRAFSGMLPAPSPSFPSCRRLGMGESFSALRSVLQMRKFTSLIPWRNMWFAAFPPPPPTPMTFIMEGEEVGAPISIKLSLISGMIVQCLFWGIQLYAIRRRSRPWGR